MQIMKRLIMILIFTTIFASAFCSGIEKITISKIKVYLDENELSTETNFTEESQSPKIKLETILSFTKLCADKQFSQSALDREIKQTELRLLNSGLFYTAKVEKMESRKNPGTYIVYITVTTGFLKRYGGGAIYAVLGDVALKGNRDQRLWFIGANKNGISYLNENSFGKPVILGGDFFTDAPLTFFPNTENITGTSTGPNIMGKATFGGMITPDFRLCVDTGASFSFKVLEINKNFVISPYISETKYIVDNFFWTFEGRVNLFPLQNWGTYIDAAITCNYTPFKNFTIAAFAAGGYSFGDFENHIKLYRNTETLYCNLGLANKEIRSGYDFSDLSVSNYIMATLELRYKVLQFTIPPCFPCNLQPYVFADVAYADFVNQSGTGKLLDAYGAGLYLNFDCPVFVTFNFSYGFNHDGKGRFCFAVMQSF